MSSQRRSSAAGSSGDPYELDRLAEELASREEQPGQPLRKGDSQTSLDLPQLQLRPLSHDNPHLTASQWNVEEFLLSRSYTSLPDLRTELREYLATLKEELVRLINDDYEAFISLSTDLRGEGSRLERMKWPLDPLRSKINISRCQLQDIQASMKEKLDRRAALREEKTLLQLLLRISESTTRLESLLLITVPLEVTTSQDLETRGKGMVFTDERVKANRAKHLLRTATEYVQLLYHSEKARAQKCTFVSEMQWRIDRIKSTLTSDLELHFSVTLAALTSVEKTKLEKAKQQPEIERAKLNSDLTDCLRAYDMLGLWRDAEDVIRRELVREFIKKIIYPGCLSGPHSPVIPHTPFPTSSFNETPTTAALHPRTPYTPFTAFPTKQDTLFPTASDIDASIYLIDESGSPLASLYNKILRFIARDLRTVMETAERVGVKRAHGQLPDDSISDPAEASGDDMQPGFDILSNVVWSEISRALMDDLGSIVFAAGKPVEFRKNFETTQLFIQSLEYLAPSLQSVNKMRAHPSFGAFERRWQLPVYFQLRWKEVVSKVEDRLQLTSLTSSASSPARNAEFVLGQSEAIWNAICDCWSSDIFLRELGHRFWRLTLQLLRRYRTWLDKSLPVFEQGDKAKTVVMEQAAVTPLGTPRASTPATQDNQGPDIIAEEDKTLYQCSVLIQDIREMKSRVIDLWKQEMSAMLPFEASEGHESEKPEDILKVALKSLTDLIPSLTSQIESILIRRCCDTLTPVKTIAGQFRAISQKNIPTKPSSFVPLILRPVRLLFGIDNGEGQAKALKEEYCASISTCVVDAVANRYMMHVTALRKNEESLRRLRMGKRSGFSFFGTTSSHSDEDSRDDERIRTQLILDVEAFGRDAELLGVHIDSNNAYKALNYMVHTTASSDTSS